MSRCRAASGVAITDFGLSLFDSAGHQLAKAPLNYSFGRVEHELDAGHGAQRMTLSMFPGFALPDDAAPWALDVSIRFYADSAQSLSPADERALTLGPGRVADDAILANRQRAADSGGLRTDRAGAGPHRR